MCEIFGVTAEKEIRLDEMLKEFFSHSEEHQNGWGIALFDGHAVTVEREPIKANDSVYLRNRLSAGFLTNRMLAHIRRATTGYAEDNNTHPFVALDGSGRSWTFVHNGHIFDAPMLRKYVRIQKGTTDSERILLYIVDQINEKTADKPGSFGSTEKFKAVEDAVRVLSAGNKLNFLLYDGENMYVHNNEENSLYVKKDQKSAVFSTSPLDSGNWDPVPKNILYVYQDGKKIYKGERHDNTYISDPEKEKSMYLQFSGL